MCRSRLGPRSWHLCGRGGRATLSVPCLVQTLLPGRFGALRGWGLKISFGVGLGVGLGDLPGKLRFLFLKNRVSSVALRREALTRQRKR